MTAKFLFTIAATAATITLAERLGLENEPLAGLIATAVAGALSFFEQITRQRTPRPSKAFARSVVVALSCGIAATAAAAAGAGVWQAFAVGAGGAIAQSDVTRSKVVSIWAFARRQLLRLLQESGND